jgi:hypothetical protein
MLEINLVRMEMGSWERRMAEQNIYSMKKSYASIKKNQYNPIPSCVHSIEI